ncbi:DNA replication factor Dna2-domain-containing protein [Crucibulum laeve]|uniref:DNA replication ATP-dependent helicase/nuclease n=1 Tax=Crucibulum laeve TaxID=68775 RepID=A0A5C3LWL1_9AGAR|nr:DNA replication factor Dna2-domain-containing protein [Crucibulum laeve]
MNSLMDGLDSDALNDSFWNAQPSPDPVKAKKTYNFQTPTKPSSKLITRNSSSLKRAVSAPSPSKVFSAGDVDLGSFLEGAENWDLDDMDPFSPKKKSPKKAAPRAVIADTSYTSIICTRCVVESVSESDYNGKWYKKLLVKLDPGEERRQVLLYDDWFQTDARIGDTINVLGTFSVLSPSSSSVALTISITSQSNFIILHPDFLLTATALSNAPQCRRKPLLSALIRSSSDITPALVWGNMLHEVMEMCLREQRWEEAWVGERIDGVIERGLSELVKLNITVENAKQEVIKRASGLKAFAERYLSDKPKPEAILTNTRASASQGASLLAIPRLLDVEEDIWSPTYGLKGKLDATVYTVVSDPSPVQAIFKSPPIVTEGPKPFEIKTGRAVASMEHRAQTMLYTLLASERYGTEVTSGLLYYTQSEEVVRVPAARNELRGLMVARNEMVSYMMSRYRTVGTGEDEMQDVEGEQEPFLPPTIDDERACNRCYVLDACMLYRRTTEAPMQMTSPIYNTYDLKTSHITSAHSEFFKKWEALISMEEQDLVRFKKELWTMGAAEREKKGRCFAGMVLDETFTGLQHNALPAGGNNEAIGASSKIHKFTYRFARAYGWGKEDNSLLHGHMAQGDPITVSVEPHLLALTRGFVLELTPSEVIVGVDHSLSLDVIKARIGSDTQRVIFRLDKDELFGGMGRIRDNLAHLFYAEGDARRRKLVVDLKPPSFSPIAEMPPAVVKYTKDLNVSQQAAVAKVLAAEDYALILGMPGTGKTTVIAALIKALVEQGKTVLLSSYTHSAVDTILLKLDDADFGILRLGNVDKIHSDIHKYTLARRRIATTVEQLEHQLISPPVVATTCLSVRNNNARKGGLDVSLFRRLSDAHPEAVADLAYQYRMNEDIMLLSNKLIYSDRLRCGSAKIAHQTLALPNNTFFDRLHTTKSSCSDGCWIEKLVSPNCKAIFVDTDLVPGIESRVGDLVQNEVEASLIYQLTESLLQCGVKEAQIGLISLYRQQVKLLSHLFLERKGIEILTADRSQGRDKDCIIISLVKSNDAGQIGDLVKDWRRMNVSFTRARSKLVIFGSRKTLQNAPILSEFFHLMDSKKWIFQLPAEAHKRHVGVFESCSTPSKRAVNQLSDIAKENMILESTQERPQKKLKKKTIENTGLIRGRPILKDLIHDTM